MGKRLSFSETWLPRCIPAALLVENAGQGAYKQAREWLVTERHVLIPQGSAQVLLARDVVSSDLIPELLLFPAFITQWLVGSTTPNPAIMTSRHLKPL